MGKVKVLICFLSLITLIKANLTEEANNTENKNYTEKSGKIQVGHDGSVDSGVDWYGFIVSNTSNNVLIVIEQMLLDKDDNLTISENENKTFGHFNGFQDPFSILVNGESISINLKTTTRSINRKFIGYYIKEECKYSIMKDSGFMSTPLFKGKEINCTFILHSPETSFSKRSITFRNPLSNQEVVVEGSGSQDLKYTGSVIPPEIISKDTNTALKLNFKLKDNSERVNFTYENVQQESKYINLTESQTVQLNYNNSLLYNQPNILPCHWIIEGADNTVLSLMFSNFSLTKGAHIFINDGSNKLSNPIKQISSLNSNDIDGTYVLSTGKFLMISFVLSDGKISTNVAITDNKQGGYLQNRSSIAISESHKDVIYLLEANENENAVIDNHSGSLSTNSSIYIYNDFSLKSKLLVVFKGTLPNYPVVSDTSRMMIIAKNFIGSDKYNAKFEGISKDCYRMSTGFSYDIIIKDSCQKEKECKWIVPPDSLHNVTSLHMHLLNFTDKDIAIINLLDKDNTKVFDAKPSPYIPELYLPSKLGFVMTTKSVNCNLSEPLLHANFEKLSGCDKVEHLEAGTKLQITSPNYPNTYPILAQCWFNITSNNSSKNLYHITFDRLDLSPIHCLNFLNDFESKNATEKMFSGSYPILPDDMLFQPTVAIEFISKPCNKSAKINLESAAGYSLNVTSADCGGTINAKEGNFSTPNYPNATASTMCIWILEVPDSKDIHHPNIINFTLINYEKKDSHLKIYDGGSVRNRVRNITSNEMLSRTNKLLFIYEKDSSKSSSGLLVKFHTQTCNMTCQNGLCLHADWICNNINDCEDNTDELNCTGKPLPGPTAGPIPTPAPSHGVSPVALWLGLPIVFILGILAAIFVPPLYRRFRSSQYHQFRDISPEA